MSDRQYLLTKKQITDLWQWAVTDRLISSGVAATLERDLEGLLRHAGAEPLTAERDALRAEVERLTEEVESLWATFDLHHKAEMRGIKAWQEATGREHVLPDTACFTKWLIEQNESLKERIAAYEAGQTTGKPTHEG